MLGSAGALDERDGEVAEDERPDAEVEREEAAPALEVLGVQDRLAGELAARLVGEDERLVGLDRGDGEALGADDTAMDEAAAVALMKDKTSVIKRPLIEKDEKVVALGFDEAVYKKLM